MLTSEAPFLGARPRILLHQPLPYDRGCSGLYFALPVDFVRIVPAHTSSRPFFPVALGRWFLSSAFWPLTNSTISLCLGLLAASPKSNSLTFLVQKCPLRRTLACLCTFPSRLPLSSPCCSNGGVEASSFSQPLPSFGGVVCVDWFADGSLVA